jgi:hypothetical protein
MSFTDNLAIVDVWTGSAEQGIAEVQGEHVHLIVPVRVGLGPAWHIPLPTRAA